MRLVNIYMIAGLVAGLEIEIINALNNNSAGIGMIAYTLIMILYYSIPRGKK